MEEVRVKKIALTERQCLSLARALDFEIERLADGQEFSRLPLGRQDEIIRIDSILDAIDGARWSYDAA